MLLKASDVIITVGANTLMKLEHVEIHEGDHIGLIGKNGVGKTTLLKTLAGLLQAEEGKIERFASIAYLPQLKEQEGTKSGGERTQAYIQDAFSKQVGILFADEPTTHLDTEHIEWVEDSLKSWKGAYVIVSHDRAFLDKVCTKIWEIDDQMLHIYKGNYAQFKEQKEIEKIQHEKEYEKYQEKKQQLLEAIKQRDEKAKRATKKPKKTSASEAKITGAKPYFAKKQKKLHQSTKALETRLEKLEKIDKPFKEKALKMSLPFQEKLANKKLIQVENLEGTVGDHFLWDKANFLIKGGDKVAIIGPNGSGKTTLLRKILNRVDGVSLSPSCRIGYFKQDLSLLDENRSILENVQVGAYQDETFVRTVLARLQFRREEVYKKVRVLSGGERVKVALAKIFVSESNTLVLDEPTNFLDIEAMEALEKLLIDYEGTLLFVSHDRRFVEKVATKVIAIEDKKIRVFDGSWKEYQQAKKKRIKNDREEQLLLVETKISEVLSRLSVEPSPELEEEFQQLLKEKQRLIK